MNLSKGYLSTNIRTAVLIACVLVAGPKAVAKAKATIPRPEHPKPQFQRDAWINLNGEWDFVMDPNVAGIKENWQNNPSKFQPFQFRILGTGYRIVPLVQFPCLE